nr:serine/threonine protein kinase [Actinomycetota bacterium]
MLENGVLVEGYRIDRLIGEGGMGVVYEATQLSLERKVALKLLTAELSSDAGFRERFRHEARIQGAMDHPNIVTVHEAGESDYGLFIAMELIRGATLKDLIVGRELDAGRTLRILSQVADALDSAHDAGLIHRDIKPHNILVRAGRRDHAFLADFGVTKVRGGTNLTKTGHFVGTVDYMAPEQIRGEPATRETDIYALGTVLYECLSGVVPFPKDSDVAVMYAHLADPPPQITNERPELPPQLDAVISTAMAKDPGVRYSSAMGMVEAFERALGEDGQAAVSIPGPVESPEDIGLREDGQPDTSPSATRPDATRAAPILQTPAPGTEISPAPPAQA